MKLNRRSLLTKTLATTAAAVVGAKLPHPTPVPAAPSEADRGVLAHALNSDTFQHNAPTEAQLRWMLDLPPASDLPTGGLLASPIRYIGEDTCELVYLPQHDVEDVALLRPGVYEMSDDRTLTVTQQDIDTLIATAVLPLPVTYGVSDADPPAGHVTELRRTAEGELRAVIHWFPAKPPGYRAAPRWHRFDGPERVCRLGAFVTDTPPPPRRDMA